MQAYLTPATTASLTPNLALIRILIKPSISSCSCINRASPGASDPTPSASGPLSSTLAWFDRCVYKCSHCSWAFYNTGRRASAHIRECGSNAKRIAVSEPVHACLECGRKVLHSYNAIRAHLQDHHPGLGGIHEYGRKHGLDKNSDHGAGEVAEPDRRWCDGCAYRCKTCGLVRYSLPQMTNHLRTSHGRQPGEDCEDGHVVLREGFTECKVCTLSVQHSAGDIKNHLKRKHGCLTFKEYERKFVEGDAPPEVHYEDGLEGIPEDVPWYNGCLYQCSECSMKSYSRHGINSHARVCPYLDGGEKTRAETKLVAKRVFVCAECGFRTLHEYNYIERHLKSSHSLSLNGYAEKHILSGTAEGGGGGRRSARLERRSSSVSAEHGVLGDSDAEQEGMDEVSEDEKEIKGHEERDDGHDTDDEESQDVDPKTELVEGDSEPELDEKELKEGIVDVKSDSDGDEDESSLEESEAESVSAAKKSWYDGCVFSCGDCGHRTWSEPAIRSHASRCRQLRRRMGGVPDGSQAEVNVAQVEMYTCKICEEGVEHRYEAVKKHLWLVHELSLEEYEGDFESGD